MALSDTLDNLQALSDAAMAATDALLALAEAIWAQPPPASLSALDDADELIATLLGLGPGDGHDELTRCEVPGCGAFFWADQGAELVYESGRRLRVCAAHAFPDDPGCRLYPGFGLQARWRDERTARECEMIRKTGRPW